MNATLETRIADREAELATTYRELAARSEQTAALDERQRLMRDIHDGVGAHLVGLLNLIGKGVATPAVLKEQVDATLDELRMAIDSTQPIDGDLATLLAPLR